MNDLERADYLAGIFQAAANGMPAHTVMYATASLIAHGIKNHATNKDVGATFSELRLCVDVEMKK